MSTLLEMRENTLLRMAESAGATFTNDEIDRMIQREYEHLQTVINMKNDEYFAKQVRTNTVATNVYAWPSDFIKLLMLEMMDANTRWFEVPQLSIHGINQWESKRWWIYNERPVKYYIIGANYYLSPEQADGTNNLRMTYIYAPTTLVGDDNAVPLVPSTYHEILEVGATNRLRKAVKEPPIDQQEYDSKILSMIETITPRVKHRPKQVRVVPGNY